MADSDDLRIMRDLGDLVQALQHSDMPAYADVDACEEPCDKHGQFAAPADDVLRQASTTQMSSEGVVSPEPTKKPASEKDARRGFDRFVKRYHHHVREDLDEGLEGALQGFCDENAEELSHGVSERDSDELFDIVYNLGILEPDSDEPQSADVWKAASTVSAGSHAGAHILFKLDISAPAAAAAISHDHTGFTVIKGRFVSPIRGYAFDVDVPGSDMVTIPVLWGNRRFLPLVRQFGDMHCDLTLHGLVSGTELIVLEMHLIDTRSHAGKGMTDEVCQLVIDRLLTAPVRPKSAEVEVPIPLSDLKAINTFLNYAGATLPDSIEEWARRTVMNCEKGIMSAEEKRHAIRALSIMLNIHWQVSRFDPIDPVRARQILDDMLFGLDPVKQRVIETIIQINRTRTLPSYGLLLCGPAGTGKSQIAYAVARILKIPWASLDLSTIHDAQALTGTSRIYENAKPGLIMESFAKAGGSNILFVINELDKANSESFSGNAADVLLALLDNLGFTDNYIECAIPTDGVFAIATANDKSKISLPLLSRFTVIDIPPYSPEEKKQIFRNYSMPTVLARLGMRPDECQVTDDALELIVNRYATDPGVRDIEQVAEHMASHALYEIETTGARSVTYDAAKVAELLGEPEEDGDDA